MGNKLWRQRPLDEDDLISLSSDSESEESGKNYLANNQGNLIRTKPSV